MKLRTHWFAWLAVASVLACGPPSLPPEEPIAEPVAEPPPAPPVEPAPPEGAEAPAAPQAAAPVATAEPAGPAPAAPAKPAEPAEPAEPAAPAADRLPGSNIDIGSMTVDGVTVKDLSCKMDGGGLGGLFGSLTLAAAFGKKKTQLDTCAAGQVETTVHWTQSGGRITEVKAESDDAKRNGCVERALRGAPAAQDAECLGTVVHGR